MTSDQEIIVHPDRQGLSRYRKLSYPARYGRYHELRFAGHTCHLNLNGEIRFIQGSDPSWPHPMEWLKRSMGNDWIYYSVRGYDDTFDRIGEYYLPCLRYGSNSLFPAVDFSRPALRRAMALAGPLSRAARRQVRGRERQGRAAEVLTRVAAATPQHLDARAHRLRRILRARVPVLPPDCRHVDYDVIPVMISEGCLYNCGFCQVKTGGDFRVRDQAGVRRQIDALAHHYGDDLRNHNALFLGQNDGLAAGSEAICRAAEYGFRRLGQDVALIRGPVLFLFGSVDSFLALDEKDLTRLHGLPQRIYINIGLESFHRPALARLAKPVDPGRVRAAFARMVAVNRAWPDLEVTCNCLLDETLPAGHIETMVRVITDTLPRYYPRGTLYLSPVAGTGDPALLLRQFREIQSLRRIDTLLYLLQRL
ncbi:radical SAM domain-containing protein [Thermodesulfobacteriota bacterium B35]